MMYYLMKDTVDTISMQILIIFVILQIIFYPVFPSHRRQNQIFDAKD